MLAFEVYKYTSPSGKSYVGVTAVGARKRWGQHVRGARTGKRPLHHAIRKYGPESFTHEVLDRLTTEAGAKRAEQLWIRELGTVTPGGYNVTTGGDGSPGVSPSDATRAKMARAARAAHTRDPDRRTRLATYGALPKSAEHRAKMSAGIREAVARRTPEDRSRTAAQAARTQWAEHREEMRASHRGKSPSAETRARLSDSVRISWIARRAKAKAR